MQQVRSQQAFLHCQVEVLRGLLAAQLLQHQKEPLQGSSRNCRRRFAGAGPDPHPPETSRGQLPAEMSATWQLWCCLQSGS
jgi:hypothetical protein